MRTSGQDFAPQEKYIADITSIDSLIDWFPDEKYVPYFNKLKVSYPEYRPVKGDGNCFYRTIAFLYLRQADLSQFSNVFENIDNYCEGHKIEFEGQSFKSCLRSIYEEKLAPIHNLRGVERQEQLADSFNSSFVLDTIMILYLRSLNYIFIKNNKERFHNYVENWSQIEEIRKYGRDSQGIEYDGMASVLDIQILIQSTDDKGFKTYIYNEHSHDTYDLFFRSSHYDILYHKDSQYLHRFQYRTKYSSPIYKKQPVSYFRQDENMESRRNSVFGNYGTPMRDGYRKSDEYSHSNYQRDTKPYAPSSYYEPSKIQSSQQKTLTKMTDNLFTSMSNLRSDKPKESNLSYPQQKPSQIKQKLKGDEEDYETKPVIRVQQYKAWESQTSVQSEPWRRIKELLMVILFLGGIGFIAFKL